MTVPLSTLAGWSTVFTEPLTETSAKESNWWFGLVKVNLHCSGAPGGTETAANDDAKENAELKVDAEVTVALKDAPEETVNATVISTEGENLVLKLTPVKSSDTEAKEEDGQKAGEDQAKDKTNKESESKDENEDNERKQLCVT